MRRGVACGERGGRLCRRRPRPLNAENRIPRRRMTAGWRRHWKRRARRPMWVPCGERPAWGAWAVGGLQCPPPVGIRESGGRRALIVTCGLFAAPFAAAMVPVAFAAVTCRGDGRED